ncbi:MAG: TIGR03086 family protein [Frankiales bacterium]|nr:TIGR03086 family protein [Frankiales bacterium]
MASDLMALYQQASDWTGEKIAGAKDLSASTPCKGWQLRDLLNHMLETQRYFSAAARGESASPPGSNPPDSLSDDPAKDFAQARDEVVSAFSADGVIEKTGPMLGIAFADALLHGWDVAKATGQDATMPDGLAEAAYDAIHGRFTDEQRKGVFAPEISVDGNATPQQRLLAYTGRTPD